MEILYDNSSADGNFTIAVEWSDRSVWWINGHDNSEGKLDDLNIDKGVYGFAQRERRLANAQTVVVG